jgi:phosphomannomutase
MSEAVLAKAREWLALDNDPDTRTELEALIDAGDIKTLEERFAGRLEFGTAGIRGILGAGPMCMNSVVVQQVSAGFADYLAAQVDNAKERGIVVGYDGRIKSDVFAEQASQVFLHKGFKVFLFDDAVPTPTTAFALLDRKAAGAVMVTASHNPPEYNGYKVYWENGAQIIPPHDSGIEAAILDTAPLSDLPDLDTAKKDGRLVSLGEDLEHRYLAEVLKLRVHPEVADSDFTVAYTPLHGVGARFVEAALRQSGYSEVHTEASQREPDGRFPTVRFPNPEEEGAMDNVLSLAGKVKADLVVANDPDTDRLAIAIPRGDSYQMLTGDQIGVLLADYLMTEGPQDSRMVAASIVSSQLLGAMAKANNVAFQYTLTGFKWIANAAMAHEKAHGSRFVMGYEEALGYTIGQLVRDKDGVSAALLFVELAAFAKKQGSSVQDRLDAIYRRHGIFVTRQVSTVLPGSEGLAQIAALMDKARTSPPQEIAGYSVANFADLNEGSETLPPSNLVIMELEGGSRVLVRPSGTEPKLKCYYELREPVGEGEPVESALSRAKENLQSLAATHQTMLKG